jgi:hypothetical protein
LLVRKRPMSRIFRCALVLSGLLAIQFSTHSLQAGMTLPDAHNPDAGREGSGSIASGEVPLAVLWPDRTRDQAVIFSPRWFGWSYDHWIVAWWRWALATPARVNPLLDPRSENCDAGHQPRKVRFLGGNFSGGAEDPPVVRKCTVPLGTAFFFPVLNAIWASTPAPNPGCNVTADPWYGSRPGDPAFYKFIHDVYVPAGKNPKNRPGSLTLSVDGTPIKNIELLYKRSRIFYNAILPDDNIFDASLKANCFDRTFVTPNVGFGYHVFIPPLPPGKHVLRWNANATLPILGDLHQDVTYHITVKR